MLDSVLDQLGINISFWYQFGLFIVVFLVLQKAFFEPVLNYLKKREEKTTLLAEQIREVQHKLDEKKSMYREEKASIYQEALSILTSYRHKAEGAYQSITVEGKAEVLKKLSEGRHAIKQEYEKVNNELILRINETEESLIKYLWR